jgi:hypothetical protein
MAAITWSCRASSIAAWSRRAIPDNGIKVPNGGGRPVTAYGFFVLPKADKTVILEENIQNLLGNPPAWQERIRWPR